MRIVVRRGCLVEHAIALSWPSLTPWELSWRVNCLPSPDGRFDRECVEVHSHQEATEAYFESLTELTACWPTKHKTRQRLSGVHLYRQLCTAMDSQSVAGVRVFLLPSTWLQWGGDGAKQWCSEVSLIDLRHGRSPLHACRKTDKQALCRHPCPRSLRQLPPTTAVNTEHIAVVSVQRAWRNWSAFMDQNTLQVRVLSKST